MRRAFEWARDVQRRYSQIGGQALAGGIALYGFLALFALLVLAVAVLGFLSAGNEHLARDVTKDLGLTGDAARIVDDAVDAARESRRLTTVLGVVGILWLGTSFALTIAAAYNAAWRVTARGPRAAASPSSGWSGQPCSSPPPGGPRRCGACSQERSRHSSLS